MKRCPYCSLTFYERPADSLVERRGTTTLAEHLPECNGRRQAKIQFVAAAISADWAEPVERTNRVLKELDEGL